MKRRANYSGNRKSLLVFILCFTFTVRSSTCCTERRRDTANSFFRNNLTAKCSSCTTSKVDRRRRRKANEIERKTNEPGIRFLPSLLCWSSFNRVPATDRPQTSSPFRPFVSLRFLCFCRSDLNQHVTMDVGSGYHAE